VTKPIIVPISQTLIDWDKLIKTIYDTTGRSPTRLLDSYNRPIGELSALVQALNYFSTEGTVKDFSFVFKHIAYSFLIQIADLKEYHQWIKESDLCFFDNVLTNDREAFAVVSGNLLQWRIETVSLTQDDSFNQRYIGDCLYTFLNQVLPELFTGFRKKEQKDGTFLLENR
jgi:hypothetical protein